MKLFFLTTLLSLVAVSCGDPSSSRKMPVENVTATNYSNEPIFLQTQNLECVNPSSEGKIQFGLHLHLNGKDVLQVEDFTDLITRDSLHDNKIISKTIYGEKVEIIQSPLGNRFTTIVSPKNVSLCADVEQYEQDTVESAALNAAYSIRKTNLNFKKAVSNINIRPITLNISPSILQSKIVQNQLGEKVKESSYWTDNALYTPLLESITFLPHSHQMRQFGLQVNFWEVPMIASHEYGHHIFQSIFPAGNSSLGAGCFDHLKERPKSRKKSFGFRIVKVDDVMTAYNEAYADLISFYTLDENERGVTGIKCLEVTRDVSSGTLVDGKSKTLTKDVLNTHFSYFEEFSSCDSPSYQEVHILGAILAYNMDRLMSSFTSSKQVKLQLISEWVNDLKTNYKKDRRLPSQSYLEKTLTSFLELTLKRFNNPQDSCEAIQVTFPALDFDRC